MANTVPLRLQIMMNLTDALKEIKKSNGYATDVNLVVRGRNKLSEKDKMPSIALLEAPQQADLSTQPSPTSALTHGEWQILLKGDVEDDKHHPTDNAHYVLADVKKCLAYQRGRFTGISKEHGESNILGMGRIIERLDFSAGIVRPSEENISPNSFFWLVITLRFAEDLKDPYAYTMPA